MYHAGESMTRNALITGASSGIGRATAIALAQSGYNILAVARREPQLQELAVEIATYGVSFSYLVADVTDTSELVAKLPTFISGKNIDVLVNNAGLALGLDKSWEVPLEDWHTMIDTNCKGLVTVTRLVLPKMVEQNSGLIVNIGSIAGNWPYPGGNVYGATKAFVEQFSYNLRCDLQGTKVRVTNLGPGMTDGNEFSLTRFSGDMERAKHVYRNTTPLMSEDIAKTISWIASLPEHVNVNQLEIMPTDQSWLGFYINRDGK